MAVELRPWVQHCKKHHVQKKTKFARIVELAQLKFKIFLFTCMSILEQLSSNNNKFDITPGWTSLQMLVPKNFQSENIKYISISVQLCQGQRRPVVQKGRTVK